MNTLNTVALVLAIAAILLAVVATVAAVRAKRRADTARKEYEAATVTTDRAKRRFEEARRDLDAQRKFLEANQTPRGMKIEPGTINVKSVANPRQVAERLVKRPTRKLGQNRPTDTYQPRDDASDALGHAVMGMVIADAVVHNHVPDQITVTDTPSHQAPDPSPSPSYDSDSSGSYDSGSSFSGGDSGSF
jgi:hypothetical protein